MLSRPHASTRSPPEWRFMGRFASTVAYYERARAPYGAEFFAAVARELGMEGGERLLDVGAGPGLLAIGFAPYCGEVVGVDPEPAMVEAARAAARRAGVTASFIEGRFEDKAAGLGAFDAVTIGRAIHRLDPNLARDALDRVVKRRGRILVCHARSVEDGRNPWLGAFRAVRDRWRDDRPKLIVALFSPAGRSRRAGRSGSRRRPRFRSNASPTAFCRCRPRRRSGWATTSRS